MNETPSGTENDASGPPTRVFELVLPGRKAGNAVRQSPHLGLSKRKLAKRLYQAGFRGAALRSTVAGIVAGPGRDDTPTGTVCLGWNINGLADRFGSQAARAACRFVQRTYVLEDEFAKTLAEHGIVDMLLSLMRGARRHRYEYAACGSSLPQPQPIQATET